MFTHQVNHNGIANRITVGNLGGPSIIASRTGFDKLNYVVCLQGLGQGQGQIYSTLILTLKLTVSWELG